MEDGPARDDELASSPFFTGSIGEAIKVAQSEKRGLIVYISGENDDSRRMDQTTWRDSKVLKAIKEQFVTLCLLQNSTDAGHFFAIYPYYEVPSISVINTSGKLLKQLGGYVSPEDLCGMLGQIIAMQAAATIVAALASANSGSMSFSTQGEASNTPKGAQNLEPEKESPSSMHNKSEASCSSGALIEEKVEDDASHQACTRMDDSAILETREKEPESNSENQLPTSESRASEEKMKQMHVSTPCDVPSDETTCRNGVPSTDSEMEHQKKTSDVGMWASPSLHQVTAQPVHQEDAPKVRKFPESLLIQVRLTNGKSIRETFNMKDRLSVVKEFINQNRDDGNDTYALAILYPRKVFSEEDMEKSLLDLSLEDRATLVLVTNSSQLKAGARDSSSTQAVAPQVTETGGNGGIWKLMSYLNPLSYFSGSSNKSTNPEPGTSSWQYEPNPNLRNSLRQNREIVGDLASPNVDEEANSSKRKKAQERNWGGKIHTLQHNDNEEAFKRGNAFWNGNSTQFGGDDPNK